MLLLNNDKSFPNITKSKFVACYLCGREYGPRSIGFHFKHCLERWKRDYPNWDLPDPPTYSLQDLQDKRISVEKYNEAARNIFLEKMRKPCGHCGRKFTFESLKKHVIGCAKGYYRPRGTPVLNQNSPLPNQAIFPEKNKLSSNLNQELSQCEICSRHFLKKLMAKHRLICAQEKLSHSQRLPPLHIDTAYESKCLENPSFEKKKGKKTDRKRSISSPPKFSSLSYDDLHAKEQPFFYSENLNAADSTLVFSIDDITISTDYFSPCSSYANDTHESNNKKHANEPKRIKFCYDCGRKFQINEKFCSNCGASRDALCQECNCKLN